MYTHWFNPENDIALATGLTRYTPPKAAVMIREAGQGLPLWYASQGDRILFHNIDTNWIEHKRKEFDINVDFTDRFSDNSEPRPWGWSAYTRNTFIKSGCPETNVPSEAQIEKLRNISHRRTSIIVAKELHKMLPDIMLAPPAEECRTMSEVEQKIGEYGRAYLKMPWSSSGRGVMAVNVEDCDKGLHFAMDSIRRQGSIMVEKAHDKVLDFAKLFKCENSSCTAIGTSVFTTDSCGSYTGNLLASEEDRVGIVTRHYDRGNLNRVVKALESIFTRIIAPHYSGILGVDMLIDSQGRLDAIVEINLRTTMGYVANSFADHFLLNGLKGRFFSTRVAKSNVAKFNEIYRVSDGKLVAGNMLLSPTAGGFAFFVEVICNE